MDDELETRRASAASWALWACAVGLLFAGSALNNITIATQDMSVYLRPLGIAIVALVTSSACFVRIALQSGRIAAGASLVAGLVAFVQLFDALLRVYSILRRS